MRTLELREVAQVISGQHILETDHNQLGQGIGYLTGPADFGLLQPTITRWTEKPKVLCQPGDILITVKGAGVGKVNLAPDTTVAIGRQLMAIRGNEDAIDTNCLFMFLQTRLAHFQEKSVGATVPGLSRDDLASLDIPYLPIDKQHQIAARLKAQLAEVDKARQAAETQLRDVRLLRTRLLKEFFVRVEVAPKKKLGDYAYITSGVTPSRDNDAFWHPAEVAWVKTGEIDFAPIRTVRESISRKALAECSLSLLPPKTVLIAITGEGKTRGRSAVLEVEATTNQHSVAVLPNDTWDANFLQLWLQSSYHNLRDLSEGRGGSRSALSGAQIKALEVPAPSMAEQHSFVVQIQAALTEIEAFKNATQSMRNDINLLPQKILTQAFGDARP